MSFRWLANHGHDPALASRSRRRGDRMMFPYDRCGSKMPQVEIPVLRCRSIQAESLNARTGAKGQKVPGKDIDEGQVGQECVLGRRPVRSSDRLPLQPTTHVECPAPPITAQLCICTKERSYHGDCCGRVFLHDPMARVWNYTFAHVAGRKVHDLCHGRTK